MVRHTYTKMVLDNPMCVAKRFEVNADAYRKRHGCPEGATPENPKILDDPWNITIKALRLKHEVKQAQEAAEFEAFMARTRPGIARD